MYWLSMAYLLGPSLEKSKASLEMMRAIACAFVVFLKLLNNAIKFFNNGGDRFIQSSNGGLQP